jgi:predicted CopG family antitoxin
MAVKTITIDMEAYDLLSRRKGPGESFSQVIKAHFGPQLTAGRLRARIKKVRVSEDALDAMEAVVRDRKNHPLRVLEL